MKKIGARVEFIVYSKKGNLGDKATRGAFFIMVNILRLFGLRFGASAETVMVEVDDEKNSVKWERVPEPGVPFPSSKI